MARTCRSRLLWPNWSRLVESRLNRERSGGASSFAASRRPCCCPARKTDNPHSPGRQYLRPSLMRSLTQRPPGVTPLHYALMSSTASPGLIATVGAECCSFIARVTISSGMW